MEEEEEERREAQREAARKKRAAKCVCGGNLVTRGGSGFFSNIGWFMSGELNCARCRRTIRKGEHFKLCYFNFSC